MSRLPRFLIACAVLSLLPDAAVAINRPHSSHASNTATGTATAVVAERISVLARTPLIFGYIESGSSAGTVTVSSNADKRQSTGKVKLLPGVFERAMFFIKGSPNKSYSMQTPDSLTFKALGATQKGKTSQLMARDFTTYSNNIRHVATSSHLDRVGLDTVYMGGTLIVPDNVAPGLYSALVPLTVYY